MIVEHIDKYILTRKEPKRKTHCFHPSSLHKSPKDLYYHYLTGENQRFSAQTRRIFDNGHAVHDRLQTYLQKCGILYAKEVPVHNDEYEICGNTDGILLVHNTDVVLEIKSMNSLNFYSLTKGPKTEHVLQINIYMFCLDIPLGCLLYECKDNQVLLEFPLTIDMNVLRPVLTKIKYVQHCIKLKQEPSNDVVFT